MQLSLDRKKWKKALRQNQELFLDCQDLEYICGLFEGEKDNYLLDNCECRSRGRTWIDVEQEDPDMICWIHSHPGQVIDAKSFGSTSVQPIELSRDDKEFCKKQNDVFIQHKKKKVKVLILGVEDGIAIVGCRGNILKTFKQ